jgi:glucokinase
VGETRSYDHELTEEELPVEVSKAMKEVQRHQLFTATVESFTVYPTAITGNLALVIVVMNGPYKLIREKGERGGTNTKGNVS